MLIAHPQGFAARRYLFDENGWEAGTLRVRYFRETAEYEVSGRRYRLTRERRFGGPFLLLLNDEIILSAEKTSVFFNSFRFSLVGETFLLKSEDWTVQRFSVVTSHGQVGEIKRLRWLSRKSTIGLPDTWPLYVRVFLFWLVTVLWDRQAVGPSGYVSWLEKLPI